MARLEAPGARLRALWRRLSPLPGGPRLFSWALGRVVPYTGRLGAVVTHLEPGHCRVRLRERRGVRNHLGSVHAVALANVGELATGLAVMGAMPPTVRGIVTRLEVTYLKKARGTLVAEARCEVPEVVESTEQAVVAEVADDDGDVVATVTAHWLLGPRPA